jgi:hypothetical protein
VPATEDPQAQLAQAVGDGDMSCCAATTLGGGIGEARRPVPVVSLAKLSGGTLWGSNVDFFVAVGQHMS